MMPAHVDVTVLRDAAHAINYSHPDELAAIISAWLADRPLAELVLPEEQSPVAVMTRRT